MKHHRKTCCHCGARTEPQPQDFNRDTGYGYCDECLIRFWPIITQLDFDTASFTLRQERKGDGILVDMYKAGQLKARNMLHRSADEIKTELIEKYSLQSTVIPT